MGFTVGRRLLEGVRLENPVVPGTVVVNKGTTEENSEPPFSQAEDLGPVREPVARLAPFFLRDQFFSRSDNNFTLFLDKLEKSAKQDGPVEITEEELSLCRKIKIENPEIAQRTIDVLLKSNIKDLEIAFILGANPTLIQSNRQRAEIFTELWNPNQKRGSKFEKGVLANENLIPPFTRQNTEIRDRVIEWIFNNMNDPLAVELVRKFFPKSKENEEKPSIPEEDVEGLIRSSWQGYNSFSKAGQAVIESARFDPRYAKLLIPALGEILEYNSEFRSKLLGIAIEEPNTDFAFTVVFGINNFTENEIKLLDGFIEKEGVLETKLYEALSKNGKFKKQNNLATLVKGKDLKKLL